MVKLIVGTRHSTLVGESEAELRRFLRSRKIRPAAAGFRIDVPDAIPLAFYRLTGDLHLAAPRLGLPRTSWGELAAALVGGRRAVYA